MDPPSSYTGLLGVALVFLPCVLGLGGFCFCSVLCSQFPSIQSQREIQLLRILIQILREKVTRRRSCSLQVYGA